MTDTTNVGQAFWDYPFDSDEEYQQGLSSILHGSVSSGTSPEEVKEILLRSRLFFFNRKTGSTITREDVLSSIPVSNTSGEVPAILSANAVANMDETQDSRRVSVLESQAPSSTTISDLPAQDEKPPLTFAQLKELIEQGRMDEIPNNKLIPDVLSETPPSASQAPVRKKPWEL